MRKADMHILFFLLLFPSGSLFGCQEGTRDGQCLWRSYDSGYLSTHGCSRFKSGLIPWARSPWTLTCSNKYAGCLPTASSLLVIGQVQLVGDKMQCPSRAVSPSSSLAHQGHHLTCNILHCRCLVTVVLGKLVSLLNPMQPVPALCQALGD